MANYIWEYCLSKICICQGTPNFIDTIYPETTVDVKVIKRKLKCAMFDIQSMGENEEWIDKNFILNYIPGLRSSARLNT